MRLVVLLLSEAAIAGRDSSLIIVDSRIRFYRIPAVRFLCSS